MEQSNHLMETYSRLPASFVKGTGAWLEDDSGKKFLDLLTGVAVCSLGHSHPAVADAICEQARTLLHTSNHFSIPKQEQLADELCRISGMDSVFVCNSGAEANEAAIKLARYWGHSRDIAVPTIIVTEGSFHGRTLATLTATGNRKVHAGFEPLVQGFARVPYNDIDAIKHVAENNSNVVAILVEPVQGEGGVNIPDADYLKSLRQICDQHNWLLMLDEIQTGMGRTGTWFAFQHAGIVPDVMTLAKALGNGMPIGACIAGGKAAHVLQPGSHGTTFGGNPLACAAALAVIKTIEEEKLVEHSEKQGGRILRGLKESLADISGVVDIRGQGLIIGIQLDRPCRELAIKALDSGVVINVTADKVIRLLPPLIISDDECGMVVDKVSKIVKDFLTKS